MVTEKLQTEDPLTYRGIIKLQTVRLACKIETGRRLGRRRVIHWAEHCKQKARKGREGREQKKRGKCMQHASALFHSFFLLLSFNPSSQFPPFLSHHSVATYLHIELVDELWQLRSYLFQWLQSQEGHYTYHILISDSKHVNCWINLAWWSA